MVEYIAVAIEGVSGGHAIRLLPPWNWEARLMMPEKSETLTALVPNFLYIAHRPFPRKKRSPQVRLSIYS